MHIMETMWSYDEERQKKVIKLEDERMARLLKKKLQDDYGTLHDVIKGEK